MSASNKKMFSGEEFSGNEKLDLNDVSDWTVEGMGGESVKSVPLLIFSMTRRAEQ